MGRASRRGIIVHSSTLFPILLDLSAPHPILRLMTFSPVVILTILSPHTATEGIIAPCWIASHRKTKGLTILSQIAGSTRRVRLEDWAVNPTRLPTQMLHPHSWETRQLPLEASSAAFLVQAHPSAMILPERFKVHSHRSISMQMSCQRHICNCSASILE